MTATLIKPTAEYLLTTPLETLLSELSVEVVETRINEPGFTGYAVVSNENEIVLAVPKGHTPYEPGYCPRVVLAGVLRVDLGDRRVRGGVA